VRYCRPIENIETEIPGFTEVRIMQALPRAWRPRTSSLLFLSFFTVLSFSLLLLGIVSAQAWTPSLRSVGQVASQRARNPNYDESKAGNFTLPDPLVFSDGKPVKTAREWRERRRAEILQLLETNVYGRSPKPPKHIRFKVFDVDKEALGGKAIRKQVTIYISTPKAEVSETLLIYIPADAPKPVPVILELNFQGNQSVTSDPGVKAATLWIGDPPVRQQAPERLRGIDKEFNVEKVLARGYGFATICYGDIEPDFKEGYKQGGLRQQFLQPGRTERAPDDWGAIGAWAYGLSRAMDYLEKDKDVDAHRVAIMGHSRLGKTVLWAGAQDERFAMVLSSCSGRGGAPPWRRHYVPFLTMSGNGEPLQVWIGDFRSPCAKAPDITRHSLMPTTDCSGRRGVVRQVYSAPLFHAAGMSSQVLSPSWQVSLRGKFGWFQHVRNRATMRSQSDRHLLAEGPWPWCAANGGE
jgi:hypothetical protein